MKPGTSPNRKKSPCERLSDSRQRGLSRGVLIARFLSGRIKDFFATFLRPKAKVSSRRLLMSIAGVGSRFEVRSSDFLSGRSDAVKPLRVASFHPRDYLRITASDVPVS